VLLLDRRRDRRRELLDVLDAATDAADGVYRALARGLHLVDLSGDDVSRLGGLHRQRLDLGGDHRKAFAGGAGPRRFDGGVERKQIGLAGDAVDELDDVVDLLRCVREPGDVPIGGLRLAGGGAHHLGGARELRLISAIDLASSSAALAATATAWKPTLEVLTAPAVRVAVACEVADRLPAVACIAATLSATVLSTPSTLWRNQAIACSNAARRASCSVSCAVLGSALRRSVMS
jgi:hypothetical protein